MAEKNTVTRKSALEFCMELPEVKANAEVAEVLAKMYASVTKPRAKSEGPSKTRVANEKLAAECVAAIREHGEPVNGKWIAEHVRGLVTPQKTTAVMAIAIERGEVVKSKDGKTVTYSIAE